MSSIIRNKSKYASSGTSSNGSAGSASALNVADMIPDETLAKLTVKELNKRVQNFPREDVVALKQRRRTLKNRG